jgi:phage terminase large subunit
MSKIIYIDNSGNLNLSKLHPTQKEFIKSKLLHSGIVGGYQSGKSVAGAVKVITKLLQDPGVPIAYYLPTYGLIDDMLIPKFTKLFEDIEVKFKQHKQESKIITPYGEIWMRSMDTPDRIVSYSVGYSLIDEVDIVHINKRDNAMKRISSRNSFKKSTYNSIDYVSTPEGFGYMYNFFVKKQNENKILYRLKTLDNEDNLGRGYIEGLREQYDSEQLRAYLDGEFVNLTSGTVYKNYNRGANHSDRQLNEKDVLHIGIDFNITNMNAVIHVIDSKPIAVAEITGAYDTETMIRLIKSKYNNSVVIYPDSSGKNRSTSGKSDIDLLKEAGFIMRYGAKNPFVKDRVNAMNNAFKHPLTGEICYYVNSNNCPVYTEALEKQGYKNGEPDKTSGFDHITEAGGYFIYGLNKPKSKIY